MRHNSQEYTTAGFYGAVGSLDECQVIIEKFSHQLRQNYLIGKSKQTCRSFNLTCNHRRQILHTTLDHPTRWNDKTIVLCDKLAIGMRRGELISDNVFELYDKNDRGDIIKVKYRWSWQLVDNGYLNLRTTVTPIKNTVYIDQDRWSKWLSLLGRTLSVYLVY